jgi:peptidoglycan/LPS O-acetylase OafA/YrhL
MTAQPAVGTFVGVQALRGLAALLVVLAHATQMGHNRFGGGEELYFGQSGVDIFFPISGFVMVVTTHRHWGKAHIAADFLFRRLIRIVPLYWAATIMKALITIAFPALTAHPNLDAWHVIASFLFIPAWDADRQPLPLLPVGWTLQFEMLFYVLFALALAVRVRPVIWLTAVLAVMSFLSPPSSFGAIGALADPILLEFAAGMFIGWATVAGFTIPERSAWCTLTAAFVALATTQMLHGASIPVSRVLIWGVPGAVALISVIALERPLSKLLAGWPALIGDASYAIYLTHGFVTPAVGVAILKLGFGGDGARVTAVIAACVISTLIGIVTHVALERRMTSRLNGVFRQWRSRYSAAGTNGTQPRD